MNLALLGFLSVGGWQVVLILVVVLVLFGGKKMPELAKGLGQSIKEFKKAAREASDEINRAVEDEHHHAQASHPAPAAPAQPGQTPGNQTSAPKA